MFVIKTKKNCIFCYRAKAVLLASNLTYTEEKYETDEDFVRFKSAGFKAFPQIYREGEHIGGYEQLLTHLDQQTS